MALIKCPNCGSIFEEDEFPTNCPMCDCKIDDTFRQKYIQEETRSQDSMSLWKSWGRFCLFIVFPFVTLIVIFIVAALISEAVSCSSFSAKTIEGCWWHDFGAEGYDYLRIKPDGRCDYDFGFGQNTDCSFSIDSRNKTITIFNSSGIEKTLVYDTGRDRLIEPGAGYGMGRISEEKLQKSSNTAPQVFSKHDNETRPNSRDDDFIFRNESDVKCYLSGVSFTDGDITLRFKYDGLYANGRLITGAIIVQEFNEIEAILTCSSPYDGSRFRFHLVQNMLVKELNSGRIYYVIK